VKENILEQREKIRIFYVKPISATPARVGLHANPTKNTKSKGIRSSEGLMASMGGLESGRQSRQTGQQFGAKSNSRRSGPGLLEDSGRALCGGGFTHAREG